MNSTTQYSTVEDLAHKILLLTAEQPGQSGRIRTARIALGMAVGGDPIPEGYSKYISTLAITDGSHTLKRTIELVDLMIASGLIGQAKGAPPALCITRTGRRALEALEAR